MDETICPEKLSWSVPTSSSLRAISSVDSQKPNSSWSLGNSSPGRAAEEFLPSRRLWAQTRYQSHQHSRQKDSLTLSPRSKCSTSIIQNGKRFGSPSKNYLQPRTETKAYTPSKPETQHHLQWYEELWLSPARSLHHLSLRKSSFPSSLPFS